MNTHSQPHHEGSKPLKSRLQLYEPLILVLACILLFTFFLDFVGNNYSLDNTFNNFMAAFFLVFGGFKAIRLKSFAEAYRSYDIIAQNSYIYSYLYPFIEIGLGLSFLFHFGMPITAALVLIIMVVNSIGVLLSLRRPAMLRCACLGDVFRLPLNYVSLGEDLFMAWMALCMLIIYF